MDDADDTGNGSMGKRRDFAADGGGKHLSTDSLRGGTDLRRFLNAPAPF